LVHLDERRHRSNDEQMRGRSFFYLSSNQRQNAHRRQGIAKHRGKKKHRSKSVIRKITSGEMRKRTKLQWNFAFFYLQRAKFRLNSHIEH